MLDTTCCIVPECDLGRLALGFCSKHYTRWTKFGHVHVERAAPTSLTAEPCDRQVCAGEWRQDWCNTHYRRRLRILKAQARYDQQIALPNIYPLVVICKGCRVNPVANARGPKNYCSTECRQNDLPECSFDECTKRIRHADLCTGHAMQRDLGRSLTALEVHRSPGSTMVRDELGRKQCAGCLNWHSVDRYHLRKHASDGLNGYCLDCEALAGIKSRYGIEPSVYLMMVELQGGACAMCRRPPASGKRLVVDHDHSCCDTTWKTCGNCVRGLLCSNCNGGLGMFRDNPATMAAGIGYLVKFAA